MFHFHRWKYTHGKTYVLTGEMGQSCKCGLHRHCLIYCGEIFETKIVADCKETI